MNDPRRFSSSQRAALYLAAGGRCSQCGAELAAGWHADHMHPFSRGGDTDVTNGQALCPDCNRRKGATLSGLRKWQERALREFMVWKPEGDNGFLVEATPGAGKTRFSIEVARQLMQAGLVERIVIAVPTRRLETQWAEDFAPFGININPYWQAADGRLADDEQGCAATYGEILYAAQNYRRLVSGRRTLVVLDEVHHCGEERSWGEAIRIAFAPAAVKLLLSGTPFRSDNNAIPFVRYVDNVGAPDFRYGYDTALADRVVRAVFFPRRGGTMEWDDPKGDRRTHTFDDKLNDQDSAHRLRTALALNGEWLPSVLGDADRQLGELRETDPDAGGIVFCEDTGSARAVAQMLGGMGKRAVLAISDEADADDRIRTFKTSRDPWLVSIRKVSEGVDIPRLRVGVFATPWAAELFFRQVVGRLVRTRPDEDDPTGYLFIPDDERLRGHAAQIAEQRNAALKQQDEELLGGGDEADSVHLPIFLPIAATATDQGVIVSTSMLTAADIAEAERIKQLSPETAMLPTPAFALGLLNAGLLAREPGPLPPQQPIEAPLHARKQNLKQANKTIVARIVGSSAYEYKEVNGILNKAVGVGVIAQASEEQLEKRLQIARQWLTSGEVPRLEW